MKRLTLIIALFCIGIVTTQAQTNNTFFLGHSLINFGTPNVVDRLSAASAENFTYDANIGNGASLFWHWNFPTTGEGDQWDLTLPNGGYENFVYTEAVPLVGQMQFNSTIRYADSLYTFANQYNPNVQYYLYETWHCRYSGNGSTSGSGGYPCDWDPGSNEDWRSRLDSDLPLWESIADSMDLIHANPTFIIPGGQALANLSDSIDAGVVPGLASIFDLFTDHHHIDDRGNYFIGCVMYSTIHGVSPVGLPNQLLNRFGVPYTVYPTPSQATIMQEIAWETVCNYSRSGVSCTCPSPDGCTDNAACNYDPAATCDDGSCVLPDGCTDNSACNYDPAATCDDGSCVLPDGCTDNTACNYDPAATCDDGSCVAPSMTFYEDFDMDGFGNNESTIVACTQPVGYVTDNTDCDDTRDDVFPGAPGTGEGIDNNCNESIDASEQATCMGDTNADGSRNVADLLMLLQDFGCLSSCDSDMTGDDYVDSEDLLAFLGFFGLLCP